jgi:hypothetical protein
MKYEDAGYSEFAAKHYGKKEKPMKVIGLTGLPRSGKDTFADVLCNEYGYTRRAFATPLKQAAAILLDREMWEMEGKQGFDREALLPEWGFTTRRFLQWFGTEGMRSFDPDFWVKRMQQSISGLNKVVITDVRFPNEVEFVHRIGGTIVRIERAGCIDNGHVSNQKLDADIAMFNCGNLDEYQKDIASLVRMYGWQ